MFRRRRNTRRAFTLIEALVATSITALAGSALLLGIASSLQTTNDTLIQAQAAGLAQQLMDEAFGRKFCENTDTPYQYPLCPSSFEAAGVARERFNDIDDFNGFTSRPPKDAWGRALGTDNGTGGTRDPNFQLPTTTLANWQRGITVYYVNPADLSQAMPGSTTSDYRAVEVKVSVIDPVRGTRPVVTLRRVHSYVPVN